ncbi:MAG TPA: hypothetical protein VGH82_06500 [Gaiellaceae bacterium]|jgi:hypothetical protein
MRRAVGIALERDRRHGDDRPLAELHLEIRVYRFAVGKSEPPAVVVNTAAVALGGVVGLAIGGPLERVREKPVELRFDPAAAAT